MWAAWPACTATRVCRCTAPRSTPSKAPPQSSARSSRNSTWTWSRFSRETSARPLIYSTITTEAWTKCGPRWARFSARSTRTTSSPITTALPRPAWPERESSRWRSSPRRSSRDSRRPFWRGSRRKSTCCCPLGSANSRCTCWGWFRIAGPRNWSRAATESLCQRFPRLRCWDPSDPTALRWARSVQ